MRRKDCSFSVRTRFLDLHAQLKHGNIDAISSRGEADENRQTDWWCRQSAANRLCENFAVNCEKTGKYLDSAFFREKFALKSLAGSVGWQKIPY